jgi:formate-dependent nitrite reductase cytochrome c552 subunit
MRVFNYPSELGARNTRYEDRHPEHHCWLVSSQLDYKVRHYVYPDFVTPRSQVNWAQYEFAIEFNNEIDATMFALYSRMRPT